MEDNETFIKPADNEESYGIKVNETIKATLFSLQSESKSFNIFDTSKISQVTTQFSIL